MKHTIAVIVAVLLQVQVSLSATHSQNYWNNPQQGLNQGSLNGTSPSPYIPLGNGTQTGVSAPSSGNSAEFYRQQVAEGQQELQILDEKIHGIEQQIFVAERNYKAALVLLNPPPLPPSPPLQAVVIRTVTQTIVQAVATPQPAKVMESSDPPDRAFQTSRPGSRDTSWLTRYFWDWVIGATVLILAFMYVLLRNTTGNL
jgi:hypothetical protein